MSEAAADLAQDLDRCEGSSERGVEGRLNDDRYIENKPLRVWTRMEDKTLLSRLNRVKSTFHQEVLSS